MSDERSPEAASAAVDRKFADLLVCNDAGLVDFRVSDSKKATGWRWHPRRRAAFASPDSLVDQPATSAAHLLEVALPYDSWCLRTARRESTKALTGLCTPEVLDELLHVITELVMHSTVESRSECTLSVHRIDEEVLIVVRSLSARTTTQPRDVGTIGSGTDAMHSNTTEYRVERAVGQRCVWARFNLLGRSPGEAGLVLLREDSTGAFASSRTG